MFDDVRRDGDSTVAIGVFLTIFRSRWTRWLLALGMALLCTALIVYSMALKWVMSEECVALPEVELTIEDMIAIKKRREVYRKSRDLNASLRLTGREVTFLLADTKRIAIWMRVDGDQVHLRFSQPVEGGCYNVDFTGVISVKDGVAVAVPERLQMGERDLSSLLGGRTFTFEASDIRDPFVAENLANIRTLEVSDGSLELRFIDKWKPW